VLQFSKKKANNHVTYWAPTDEVNTLPIEKESRKKKDHLKVGHKRIRKHAKTKRNYRVIKLNHRFTNVVHAFELARPMARRRQAYAATKKRKRFRCSQPGSRSPQNLKRRKKSFVKVYGEEHKHGTFQMGHIS
jgi:hypothetical protein